MKFPVIEVRLFPGRAVVRWKPDGEWIEGDIGRVGLERFFIPDYEGFVESLRVLHRKLKIQPQAKTFLGAVFKPVLEVSILEFPDRFYPFERRALELSLRSGLIAQRIFVVTPEAFDDSLRPHNE